MKKATARAKPIDIEVLDAPAHPDQQLVTAAGDKLREFLGGLTRFFETAAQIERGAKERLDRAKQLKLPTDAAADEKIQLFIRESKDEITAAEEHWTITAVVHNLHRQLTSARGRSTGKDSKGVPIGMLDQAAAIAQNLHNTYTEAEKRRARAEEDRITREREDAARQEQARVAAQLEEQALAAEKKSPELSERETTFVDGILRLGLRATAAAERAGFKNPAAAGERLMNTPKISQALDAKKAATVLREQATATREMPVDVERHVERPNISRAAGGYDRTTWSGEVFDEDLIVAAVLDPRIRATLGIPADIVTINRVKINEYGSSMQELINKWPGVRAVKKTTTV